MFNLQNMSGQYQGANADADLGLKQQQQLKVMQEVYDLSINNEVQKVAAAEAISPEARAARKAQTKAETATSEATMWESWNTVRDNKHEAVESSFAVYNTDPSQESYDLARKGVIEANPQLAGVLPAEHSEKSGALLKQVQRSWLNNREFKQKLVGMGYNAELQEGLNAQKYGNDREMQSRDIQGKISMMREDWDRRDWNTGLTEQGANKRARMSLESGLQIAERFQQEGRPDLAMRQLQLVQEQEHLLKMAKSSGNPYTAEKDRQTIRQKNYDKTKDFLEQDWSNDAASVDKDLKIFEARGMSQHIDTLQTEAEKFGIKSDKAPGWIKDRMALWPGQKTWIRLPLDENGNPVGGYTSDAIRKLIGKKVDSSVGAEFGRSGWTGSLGVTRYISDLDEAMAVYADLMKNMYNEDITK